jgi:carbamoyl-phosphate synthase large subunit
MLPTVQLLSAHGVRLAATEDTAAFLRERGFSEVRVLHKVSEPERRPNVRDALEDGEVDLILNVPSSLTQEKFERMLEDEYALRRRAVELGIPLHTNLEAFAAYVEGIVWLSDHPVSVEPQYGAPEPGGDGSSAPAPALVTPSRARLAATRKGRGRTPGRRA